MLQYLNSGKNLKNGYHLGDILTKVCFVYGDKSVFDEFENGVQSIASNQNYENSQLKIQTTEDLEKFAAILHVKENPLGGVNVKNVYRSTTLFIAALGRHYNISAPSSFDIVISLTQKRCFNETSSQKLLYAVAIACEIRLR